MMTEARIGGWIQTYTGAQFYPFDPRLDDIDIRDIAHALAVQNRFAGHTWRPYSVAEHCVRVSRIVPPEDALWGLLHDASEAYLIDVPRPIKRHPCMAGYLDAETYLMGVICERYGLAPEMPASVRWADNALLVTEARDLLGNGELPRWEYLPAEPLADRIQPWDWRWAKSAFLERFNDVRGRLAI